MNAAHKLATYADLMAVPEHHTGEILYGQLHVQPRPAIGHARAASRLGGELHPTFGRSTGGPDGWLILDEPELHLGAHVLVPDLAGWRRSRLPSIPADTPWLELAADWVCEILSPSTARIDRSIKMRIYAEQDVRYLWLVDPLAQTLEAYELHAARWTVFGTWAGDTQVRIPPFEALELPLTELWAD